MLVCDLFLRSGLCKTKSEFRRLVQQSGARVNNIQLFDHAAEVFQQDIDGTRWTALKQNGQVRFFDEKGQAAGCVVDITL